MQQLMTTVARRRSAELGAAFCNVAGSEHIVTFFQAAKGLVGPDSNILPGRQKLLDEFRRLACLRQGTPDLAKVIIASLRRAKLVRVVPGKRGTGLR
jgi:hypothetical protein